MSSKYEQQLNFMTNLHLPNMHRTVVDTFLIININNSNNFNNLQIMGCDSIQQCNYIYIWLWGETGVFQEIIFEQTSHINFKYRKMYTICRYLSYFPSTSPGTATRPSPASVHGLMGQRGRKSKNESGLPHSPPPPSGLCIHHCLNSCASRVSTSRSREKISAAISFWGNSTRPTGLGMNENKGVRRIVFSITS